MDIGIEAKCSKCGEVLYLYTQTHRYTYNYSSHKSMIGGMCPLCCTEITALMNPDEVIMHVTTEVHPKLTIYPYYGEE